MTITLSKPFARNGKVEDYDVRQLKKTLNRLGYYQPLDKTGITGIPDDAIFSALKKFQEDHDLKTTGEAKSGDSTIELLNKESDKTPDGYYIWRTVEDDKVRPAHAQYNRTMRKWSDSPDPGDDYNCRCWAEPVAIQTSKTNCDLQREKLEQAQKKVKDLSIKFNSLLLRLDELIKENNELIERAQKNLGSQSVAYILEIPFEELNALSELLRKYFGNIISNQFLRAADNFMRQAWAVKQKAQYARDQRDMVFVQLEQAAKDLEEAKERLKNCEKDKE